MKSVQPKSVRTLGSITLAGATLVPVLALARALPGGTSTADSSVPVLEQLSHQFRSVAKRVEPSVVHIEVAGAQRVAPGASYGIEPQDPGDLLERLFRGPHGGLRVLPQVPPGRQDPYGSFNPPRPTGTGSGWVYDGEGHIITNNHVVDGAERIRVRFFDGSECDAELVATDEATDVAVLAVEGHPGLVPARLAQEAPEQGDIVFAFGSPLRFEFSMSQGVVAGTDRRTGILGPGGYEEFIQTDAAINPGNSGGPLTDVHGRVLGMNASIASNNGLFNGIGFAIPVHTMRPVIEQLIHDGRVRRGYLGVYIQDDPDLLRSFGYEGRGVLISDVMVGGPAADSSLRRGDIVTQVEGRAVEDAEQLRLAVATLAPGARAYLTVVRDGEELAVAVELGQAPQESASSIPTAGSDGARPSKGAEVMLELGLAEVSELTPGRARELDLDTVEGVLIESVRPQSAAALAGLRPGQVLTEVGDRSVATPKELASALAGADLASGARVTVVEGGRQRYALLRLPQ